MKKLKIGYFADGPWSHETFKKLIKDETIEFGFIVPRADTQDETLKNFATEYNIDYIENVQLNSDEFYETAKKYECDLFISMSFNQIFRTRIINLPPLKTINCHAGKLPFYRGRNILNWVLINDEKEFGITVHYIDEGIDTGDIIIQQTYPITDEDDYKTLVETAYVECSELLYKGVKRVQEGNFTPIVQTDIHPVGFYCGRRNLDDVKLSWLQTSREVFNFVRSVCYPCPMATAMLKGKEMKINKVKMVEGAVPYINTVGQIVGKNGKNLIVKTTDTVVEVVEFEYDGVVRVGDRFDIIPPTTK